MMKYNSLKIQIRREEIIETDMDYAVDLIFFFLGHKTPKNIHDCNINVTYFPRWKIRG